MSLSTLRDIKCVIKKPGKKRYKEESSMREGWKKVVSAMLCAAMVVSMSGLAVSADGENNDLTGNNLTKGEEDGDDLTKGEKDGSDFTNGEEGGNGPSNNDGDGNDLTNNEEGGNGPAGNDEDGSDLTNGEEGGNGPAGNDGDGDDLTDNEEGGNGGEDDSEGKNPNNLLLTGPNRIMPLGGSNVCTVGDVGYPSLQNAINSNSQNTIIIVLNASVTEDVTIPAGTTVTIDLNGQTIKNSADHTITVQENAKLTITGNGTVDNVTHARAAIWNDGTVMLNGGTYTRSLENGENSQSSGGNSYYNIVNHGTMTINSGVTVKQDGHFSSMIENGWYSGSQNTDGRDSVMIINGGAFSGGLNTIKNDDYGNLTINDGTFTNTTQAAILNWNKAEITGGNFTSDAQDAVVLNGFADGKMDQGILNISGGSFTATDSGDAIQDMGGASAGGQITITGGTFTGDFDFGGKGSKTVTITNATITGDVKAANNVTAKMSNSTIEGKVTGDGSVTIENVKTDNIVATVDGKGYESLTDALDEAAKATNKTVILQKDAEYNGKLTIPLGVTLDGNGYTLKLTADISDGAFVEATSDGVTIQNIIIDADGKAKHGVQFYCCKNGKMQNVTVQNSYWTAVQVNGAEATITGCTFAPKSAWVGGEQKNPYANIEFSMGKDVTIVPKLTLNATKGYNQTVPLVYMDQDTIKRIEDNAGAGSGLPSNPTPQDILNYLQQSGKLGGSDVKNAQVVNGIIVVFNLPVSSTPDTNSPSGNHSTGNSSSSSSSSSNSGSHSLTPEQSKQQAIDAMWKRAINKINAAKEGSRLKIYMGINEEIPDYVLAALRENNVTVTFYNQDGEEVTIPAGMAPQSLRSSWTLKQLGNYVLGLDAQGTETEKAEQATQESQPAAEQATAGAETGKPNPETGDASAAMMAIAAAAASLCGVVLLSNKKK